MKTSMQKSSKRRRISGDKGQPNIRQEADGSFSVKLKMEGKCMRICCPTKEDALLASRLHMGPSPTIRREEDPGEIVEGADLSIEEQAVPEPSDKSNLRPSGSTLEIEILPATILEDIATALALLDAVSMEGFQTAEELQAAYGALTVVKQLLRESVLSSPHDTENSSGLNLDQLAVLSGMQCEYQQYVNSGKFKVVLRTRGNVEAGSVGYFSTEKQTHAACKLISRCKKELKKYVADVESRHAARTASPSETPAGTRSSRTKQASAVVSDFKLSSTAAPVLAPPAPPAPPSSATVPCLTNIVNPDEVRNEIAVATVQPAGPPSISQGQMRGIPLPQILSQGQLREQVGGSEQTAVGLLVGGPNSVRLPLLCCSHGTPAPCLQCRREIMQNPTRPPPIQINIQGQKRRQVGGGRQTAVRLPEISGPYFLGLPLHSSCATSAPFLQCSRHNLQNQMTKAPPIQLNFQGQERRQVGSCRQTAVDLLGGGPLFVGIPLHCPHVTPAPSLQCGRENIPNQMTRDPPIQLNVQGQERRQVGGGGQQAMDLLVSGPNFVGLPLCSHGTPAGLHCLQCCRLHTQNPSTGGYIPFSARDHDQQIDRRIPPRSIAYALPQTAATRRLEACCKDEILNLTEELLLFRAATCDTCGKSRHTKCAYEKGQLSIQLFQIKRRREQEQVQQLIFTCTCGKEQEVLSPMLVRVKELISRLAVQVHNKHRLGNQARGSDAPSKLLVKYKDNLSEVLYKLKEVLEPATGTELKATFRRLSEIQARMLDDVNTINLNYEKWMYLMNISIASIS